jgi:hypothetical protein
MVIHMKKENLKISRFLNQLNQLKFYSHKKKVELKQEIPVII